MKLSLAVAGYPRARRQHEVAAVTNLLCVFGLGQLVPGSEQHRTIKTVFLCQEAALGLILLSGWKKRSFQYITDKKKYCQWLFKMLFFHCQQVQLVKTVQPQSCRASQRVSFGKSRPEVKFFFQKYAISVCSCLGYASMRGHLCPRWDGGTHHVGLTEPEGSCFCLLHLKALCCPDIVRGSTQCRPIAARHRHCHALSLPPLITWPLPRHHHPPARLPLFAAGFLMAARRPLAAQTHGAPFMESPFCSRLDSPGRRWPLTPVTSHCRLSESWSALSWIRRYHHTTTDPIKNKFVMLTSNVTLSDIMKSQNLINRKAINWCFL